MSTPAPHEGPDDQRPEAIRPDDIMTPGSGGARPSPRTTPGSSPLGEAPTGPGVAGVFGPGTPIGEATGWRLAPRRRWVACVLGVLAGWLGAQSFYTGRLLRGAFQAGLVVSSGLLALITLGLLAPLFTGILVLVWGWGAVEGIAYAVARRGAYSRDALGGPLV